MPATYLKTTLDSRGVTSQRGTITNNDSIECDLRVCVHNPTLSESSVQVKFKFKFQCRPGRTWSGIDLFTQNMALLPLLLSLAGVCGRTRAVKPNVLFVVVDDLAPAFEAYGSVGPPLLYTSCMESAIFAA